MLEFDSLYRHVKLLYYQFHVLLNEMEVEVEGEFVYFTWTLLDGDTDYLSIICWTRQIY